MRKPVVFQNPRGQWVIGIPGHPFYDVEATWADAMTWLPAWQIQAKILNQNSEAIGAAIDRAFQEDA